jgi:beta-lactamase regulating signal transducer with metallopeptidase domain
MPLVIVLLLAALKASLLVGAALLLCAAMRRTSAAARHAVLLAAVAAAALLPLLAAALPTLPAPPSGTRWLGDEATRFAMIRSDTVSSVPIRPALRERIEGVESAILALWSVGTGLVLCRIAADAAAARRVCARAKILARIGPGLNILGSREIGGPATVGLARPSILLPASLALDPAALREAIAHERAHVNRRDALTFLVARIACAVHWFNPLVWYAVHRIGLEQEQACDDRVLASGADPVRYSEMLVGLARRQAFAAAGLHAARLLSRSSQLERRIRRVLDPGASRGSLSRRHVVALGLLAACVTAPLAALGVQDGPPGGEPDPFQNPRSERLPAPGLGAAVVPIDVATPDGALIQALRRAAERAPAGPVDLVPDRARWALTRVREGRIVEPMIVALEDPDWRVRSYAAWTLGAAGDPRAVEPLLPLLRDRVWRLRAMTASALRQIGDRRAAPALEEALDDPAWQVRVESVAYLGAIGERSERSRLEPLRHDPHIAVRLAAEGALAAGR